MTRTKWLLLVAIIWVAIIGGFIGYKQYTITTGTDVLLRMQPVDPRDVFRGDYMVIRYEIGEFSRLLKPVYQVEPLTIGKTVYVELSVNQEKVVTSGSFLLQKPPAGSLFLKGTVRENGRIEYGIESYFIPEGTGSDLSNRLWQDRNKTYVRVSIDKAGRGIVRGFVVDGKEIELKDLKQRN